MSFYTIALFAHILGVLGLFIGIGFEWAITLRLRYVQTIAQVREWTSLTSVQEILMRTALLLILVAGVYMTITVWGWRTPWIVVSLAALIFQGALSGAVNSRRLKAIHTAAATAESPTGSIPARLER